MKVSLFEFQKDALHALRDRLVAARRLVGPEHPQAIAFAAPTGSGKTIIMTALFEAILVEPDGGLEWPLDWSPQPDAVILWVSDMPELNEQTRLKLESMSSKVNRVHQLVVIDSHFDAPQLEGGRVYFVNTQKLAVNQPLTNRGDGRQHLIWETLTNTARTLPDRFYVVIDEAHRGMTAGRGAQAARTLMQRFLLGYPEVGLVKMPLVIGVSATPRRFMELLDRAPHTVHKVHVPAEAVRGSGLLKDRVLIHHPQSPTTAEMALLEEAARRWDVMGRAWADYCKEEGVATVWPVLVVQVENGSDHQVTKTDLVQVLEAIEGVIGRRLSEGEVAHTMHDTGDMDVGGRRVRKVEASRIDADKNIGVVLFKTSLSTGWDCPRAEVMMSFRRAEDHTYIAQLLGRMVRTPLARRIERDAALNDVHLFLPHFDTHAVQAVVAALQDQEHAPPAEAGSSRELVVLARRPGSEAIFRALDGLVTYRVNAARAQSPLRRYMAMVFHLNRDRIDEGAWGAAKLQVVGWMRELVETMRSTGTFGPAVRAVTQVGLQTLALQAGTGLTEHESDYLIAASTTDIERLFAEAGRAFSHGLHVDYWRMRGERDSLATKVEAIILARDAELMSRLEKQAEVAFEELYERHKRTIYALKEHRRSLYDKLRLATAKPVELDWRLPESIDFRRLPDAPLRDRHLYVDADGRFRAELGTWEAGVLAEELADPSVVGWLRNVDRKPWSLEIPYASGGEVRPMFPDLVVVRQTANGYVVDILEPHNPSLADNFEKAVGLARFAERHGGLFGRIQMIRQQTSAGGDRFVRLDINGMSNTRRLSTVTSNPALDALFASAT